MISSRLKFCLRCWVRPRFFTRSTIKLNDVAENFKKAELSENGFAHRVLENLERYNLRLASDRLRQERTEEVLNLSEIQWKNLSANELCRVFNAVSVSAKTDGSLISDIKYNDMCASIAVRCPDLTDSQLKSLLTSLACWPPCSSSQEPNFFYIWKAIDNAFVTRHKNFKPEKVLEITELWYQLHLTRRSDFVYQGLNRLAKRPNRLKSEQVVLLLFYQNVLRTLSKNVKMFPVVERFREVIHDLTIEEIGVACMGFFKTENPIQLVDVVDAIISKLIKNAETVPEITLASIMKALRYKLPIALWHRIPELMDSLVTQVDRLSVTSAVHIPLILTGSQTIHKNTLDAVAEKLIQQIDSARTWRK
uniref:FAST kinase domain-containing protein 5 n=1 Tax=Lygus hesperus TaxID=30085 RepID=A0A0A9XXF6_LYGHE